MRKIFVFLVFISVIQINAQTAKDYFDKGITKFELGHQLGAIDDFNKAIEINPQYAEAYYERGLVKSVTSDNQGAILDYDKAIELNPQDARVYFQRSLSKYFLDDMRGFQQDKHKGDAIEPKSAEGFNNKGIAEDNNIDNTGQSYWKAIENFNKAIELNPQYAEAYLNRGKAKYKQSSVPHNGIPYQENQIKMTKEALQDIDKAIELNPQYAEAYFERGYITNPGTNNSYLKQLRLDIEKTRTAKEVDLYKEAIDKERLELEKLINTAQKAIEDYSKAIKINPQYAEAYFERGDIKYYLSDKQGACSDWNKAGEIGLVKANDVIKRWCN